MAAKKRIEVDSAKISKAINSGIPLTITTYTLPHEMEVYMGDVLTVFLKELDQTQMVEYLNYCLNELITNAKKANTKRIYFKQKNLDITNPDDYELGLKTFKEDTLNNINYYLDLQKKAGLYVKLILQVRNNKIKIEVRNNSSLTVFEYKRIHDKLSRAQQYTSVEDALSQILDDSEGAGLGLVIMILMLEKIGLTEENFQSLCENGETITRIILPLSEKTRQQINFISAEFVKLIDNLPQFPENITAINRLLNDPDSKMSDIALQISNDVALTGELLKMVNSAAFALASPCRSISDAVKLVGIRGIKNLLFSIGTMQTFKEVGGDKADLWTHAYQVAFYSYNLARNFFTGKRAIIEDSYICGLLHDMGKIIFETSHPDLLNRVKKICEAKGISSDLIERLIAGVNHGEIGSEVAKKWNFPEVIINVIKYHHDPEEAPAEVKDLTSIVYLADIMTYYQTNEVAFYQIDSEILKIFKITTEDQFKKVSDKLLASFSKEQEA
ncbi:MAG: HDOD domain-containing protein [Treponema sp.]|uniref:HDOD domain-containing protein n=1 Tax=Treponema sp. TaxID=166 RepID=UPI001B3EE2EF|nr:HDOD domain-containing protein [Treponema sp.]MBP5402541.1 HDOD domain-containing protein [Treponema sp.]MBR5933874.1 HDOD domain-containing protein [Treponema sp.]